MDTKKIGMIVFFIITLGIVLTVCLVLAFQKSSPQPSPVLLNKSPIIGVVSETDPVNLIAQSYVSFLAGAGARVVPVFWNDSSDTNRQKMNKLNGLVMMGATYRTIFDKEKGDLNAYAKSVCDMIHYAMELTDKGDYFPIYAVCYSYEVMTSCLSSDPATLMGVFSDHQTNDVLLFTPHAKNTSLFGYGTEIYTYFEKMRVSHFNHEAGITKPRFSQDHNLSSLFNVLAYQTDDYGEEFVAAIQSSKYPLVGLQFHPEKNSWEYNPHSHNMHFYESILATQWVSDYIVNMTRKNAHEWDEEDAHQNLIWRYPLSDGSKYGYEQAYIFDTKEL